jgi:hypothetical protein
VWVYYWKLFGSTVKFRVRVFIGTFLGSIAKCGLTSRISYLFQIVGLSLEPIRIHCQAWVYYLNLFK